MTAARSADAAAEREARDFTPVGYRALLQALFARGYEARSFSEAEPSRPHLVLRHDLDMSLEAALPIAEIEAELGVSAVYFLLLRSEFYNLHAPRARSVVVRLQSLGHTIGLHFDASLYDPDDLAGLDRAAAAECAALEAVIETPVRLISFHRPAPALVGLDRALAGRDHAYRPRYVKDMGYCSDSRGAWHHGHPLDHAAVAEGRALHLLTHPIWWTGTPDEDPVAKLQRFLADRYALLQQELAANCEPFRHHVVLGSDPSAETTFRGQLRMVSLDIQRVRDHLPDLVAIGSDVDGEYWTDQHFLMDLPAKWSLSFAAWSAGQPIGYAVLSRKAPRHVHLHHLMVSLPFRGIGVGALMMSEMLERAQAIGAQVLTLKVAGSNWRARRFYENHGFAVTSDVGERVLLRKELAVEMLFRSPSTSETDAVLPRAGSAQQ